MNYEIEVQWPDTSLGEARDFANRLGCEAHKTKHRGYFKITTEDPINFYWLGANIHNTYFNQIEKSNIAKFTEL